MPAATTPVKLDPSPLNEPVYDIIVEDNEELKSSLAVTLVLNDPLSVTSEAISVANEALFALVAISVASDELKEAVAALSSVSVTKVSSNDELNVSKSVTLVEKEPLSTTKEAISVAAEELFDTIEAASEALSDAIPVANELDNEDVEAFNAEVIIISSPFIVYKLPVTRSDPVLTWVSSKVSPNFVEPLV